MRIHLTIVVALMLSTGTALPGQMRSAEAELKAAQQIESIEGDLEQAIQSYRRLLERQDLPRTVAAHASLGLARSLEKRGAAEARAMYARVVRDFADQPAIAAEARERLGRLEASAPMTGRLLIQLSSSIAVLNLVSDGRIGGTDWATGDLVIADPATGGVSHLVAGDINRSPGTFAQSPLLSPDGRWLAYLWFGDEPRERNGVLRVVSTVRGGTPRTVVADPGSMSNVMPVAWSRDAASILVCYEIAVAPVGGTSADGDFVLAWVALDGRLTPIKRFEAWRRGVPAINSIGKVSLSPDGGWIAYAVPEREGSAERSIFVMRADGSEARRLASGGINEQPVWTPDGRRLIFLSNRSGSSSLWSVLINERGSAPSLIREGIGHVYLHGFLRSDALVYEAAGLDPLTIAEFTAAPSAVTALRSRETLNGLVPAWSPDGRYLAYKRRTTRTGRALEMVIRESDTGRSLVYAPATGGMGGGQPTWYPDGTVQAIGRSGVRVRVAGLTLEEVAVPATLPHGFVSPDGRTLYAPMPEARVDVFDVATGTRRESLALPRDFRAAGLSPDGRTLALLRRGEETSPALALIGVDGTGFRQLSALDGPAGAPEAREAVAWTRDGGALLAAVYTGSNGSVLTRVPLDGGPAVTVAHLGSLRAFAIDRDARRVAYSVDRPTTDVWSLDLRAVLK